MFLDLPIVLVTKDLHIDIGGSSLYHSGMTIEGMTSRTEHLFSGGGGGMEKSKFPKEGLL